MTRTSRSLLAALVVSLVTVQAASAQPAAASGRHLVAFRSEAELAKYFEKVVRAREEAERREEEARRKASSCGGSVSVNRRARASAPGDSVVIVGTTHDSHGTPLAGVTVRLRGEEVRTRSDAGGRFRLVTRGSGLPKEHRATLLATLIGFAPRDQEIRFKARDSLTIDLPLCQVTTALQEVVVVGYGSASAQVPGQAKDESITNNQEAAVDEGGIVKVHGRYLIVLRRGRLFTIELGDRSMRPISSVDAFGPDIDPGGAWYDELVTHGDRVVVIGYSYQRGGSELGIFRIDSLGGLRHLSTHHLRSNDYYSARNYASRVVGGKLVMYSPLYLESNDLMASMPAMRRWSGSAEAGRFQPIAMATSVFRPVSNVRMEDIRALHTLTTCDLASEPFTCSARVVMGPAARTFYVSPSAVYLWVSPWRPLNDPRAGGSTVYRMPIDGGAPSAVQVTGSPVDQFSFAERSAELDVLVRGDAAGDAMWRSIFTGGSTALARIPLGAFGDGSQALDVERYTELPDAGSGEFHNRFVGDHLLYGAGAGWVHDARASAAAFVLRVGDVSPAKITLPHGVDRIEAMGRDAVVMGAAADSLYFSAIRLAGTPGAAQRIALANAAQGETRSHGFFYKPDSLGESGTIGLPIASGGRAGYEQLRTGSASVAFIRNDGTTFRIAGRLAARSSETDDACRASCVDWYGNARPIFLRGRIFALLGYELVEGIVTGGAVRDVGRVSFAPRAIHGVAR